MEKTLKEQIMDLKMYREWEIGEKVELKMFTDVIEAAEKWDNLLRQAGKVGLTEEDFNKMVEGANNA